MWIAVFFLEATWAGDTILKLLTPIHQLFFSKTFNDFYDESYVLQYSVPSTILVKYLESLNSTSYICPMMSVLSPIKLILLRHHMICRHVFLSARIVLLQEQKNSLLISTFLTTPSSLSVTFYEASSLT